MRAEELRRLVHQKPFQPFVLDLVDGRAFQFNRVEEFLITDRSVHTVDTHHRLILINMGLISMVRFPGPPAASEAS